MSSPPSTTPDPRGLNYAQLTEVLTMAFASPKVLGASVVILNPTQAQPDDQLAHYIVDMLTKAMQH